VGKAFYAHLQRLRHGGCGGARKCKRDAAIVAAERQ
jgi:hypothetical protein